MKRSGAVLVILAVAISLLSPAIAASPPKAGQKCTKLNKKQNYKNYQFTCVSKNGKLVWSKGPSIKKETSTTLMPSPSPSSVATIAPTPSPIASPTPTQTPTPTPTPTKVLDEATYEFSDICEKDPFIPKQWRGMEELVNTLGHECSWPYRIVKREMPTMTPKTTQVISSQDVAMCRLQQGAQKNALVAWQRNEYLEFWKKYQRHPALNSVIQVIPIFSPDAPDNGRNPYVDYEPYFDFLKAWVDHASDGKGKLTIRVPDRYIEFPEKIRDFKLTHERSQEVADNFRNAIEKHITPKLNLSGAHVGVILLPAGSDFSLTQQVGLGQIRVGNDFMQLTIFPPYTLSRTLGPGSNFIHPAWWLHEMHHATVGFDDTDNSTERGLHMWGLMSYGSNEMLGWHKWLLGLWDDSRIYCASSEKSGTYWIVPSTYQSTANKLIVIPVSETQVIVVESMRAGGLSYKMPKWMEGVLVYGVENTTRDHHTGTFVLRPANRKILSPTLKGLNRQFINSDVALKEGEFVTFQNIKISVVESGTFGDVVRVEKA